MFSTVIERVWSLFGFEPESRKRRSENTDCGESLTKKVRRIERPFAFSNYFTGNLPSTSEMSKPVARPQLHVKENPDLMFVWDKKNPGKENKFSWNLGTKEPDADVVVLEDEEEKESALHKRNTHFKSHMPDVRQVPQKTPMDIEENNLSSREDEDVIFINESSKQDVQNVYPSRSRVTLHPGRRSDMWTSSECNFMDIRASTGRPKNKLDTNFNSLKSDHKASYDHARDRLSLDLKIQANHAKGMGNVSSLDSPSVKNRVRNGNLSRAAILKRSLPPPPVYFGTEPKMSSRWSGLDDKMRKNTSAISLCSAIDEMKAYNHMLQQFTSESATKRLMTRLDGQVYKIFESQLKKNYSYSQLLKKRMGGKSTVIVDTIDLSKSDDDAQEVECLDEARALAPPKKEPLEVSIVHPVPRRVDVQRNREMIPKTSGEAVIINETLLVQKPPNAVEQMIKKSHVTDEDFLKDIMHRYADEKDKIGKEMEREQLKKKLWSERRQKFEGTLEERLKRYMKITEVALDDIADSKEEEKLPELTQEMFNTVHEALRKGRSCVLARLGSNTITGADLHTLSDSNWLNDEVINNYMDMLTQRSQSRDYPSVYCFNTFFYPKLSNNGYSSVKRWTKKVDIFEKDMVIIPLHLEIHWALAVVDFRQETICYYDSMNSNKSYILELIRRYLQEERMDKKKEKYDTSKWTVKLVQDIPQQRNGYDCGVFACMFAEHLSRGIVKDSRDAKQSAKCCWSYPPFPFSQENMPYFRKRMMYEILMGKILQ